MAKRGVSQYLRLSHSVALERYAAGSFAGLGECQTAAPQSNVDVPIDIEQRGAPQARRHLVALWDQEESRLGSIRTVVCHCNAQSLDLPIQFGLLAHEDISQVHAAVVGVDSVNEQAQGVRVVRWLAENGARVVAAGAGASRWPLRMHCQVLLAGAVALLDSALPEFGNELSRRLSALLSAEEERRSEGEQLRRLMRAHGLVARSDVMLDAFRRVLRIARLSNLPVLISGESGTGKELVARAIHARDPARADHPFVAVNCAAIAPAMAESELFGHRRGAFTGADRDRKGLMRSANAGVLFLDEIGDLGADVQAKLLRVLQEGRVLGVGEDVDVPVDLRIVAATNRDLSQMVADKRFRLDLYHRLNVLPLRLPPLRERQEDIEPLVAHLVAKHGGDNAGVEGASAEFLGALSRLTLPGNVRQLENLVTEALVNRSGDGPLSLTDLPREALAELAGLEPAGPHASTGLDGEGGQQGMARNVQEVVRETGWDLSKSLQVYERMIVEAALTQTAKNQSEAARLLGVTPRTIYNLVRRHHLNV